MWPNPWSNCMNVSYIVYESGKTKKYSLNVQYSFVYVFYILRFYPLDLCLFLNLLKLRTHYCLALCYCYWEIWCQTDVLPLSVSWSFCFEAWVFEFFLLWKSNSLNGICLEVSHSVSLIRSTVDISLCKQWCKCKSFISGQFSWIIFHYFHCFVFNFSVTPIVHTFNLFKKNFKKHNK